VSTLRASQPQAHEIAFESYGVRIAVRTDQASVVARLPRLVPPVHRPADPGAVDHRLVLTAADESHYSVTYTFRAGAAVLPGDIRAQVVTAVDLELAFAMLEAHVHSSVALYAPDHVFVNAAVVEHRGSAILLPGRGISGRTTLALALVEAGATFYSDMYAALDRDGRVHPYASPLRELTPGPKDGIPAGAIVLTNYVPGTDWRPRSLSRGQCMVELLTHTVPAQERPEHAMRGITALLDSRPLVLSGDRDEADDVAGPLLAELERSIAAS
jgi:hypothetical protein